MDETSIVIDDIVVEYGKTSIKSFIEKGYNISHFEQIIEDPTLATCNLNKDNKLIAVLYFYNIKEQISSEKLINYSIDYAYKGNKKIEKKSSLPKLLFLTITIHCITAFSYLLIYSIPILFSKVQNTDIQIGTGAAPAGMILLILPAIIITFIWGGLEIHNKSWLTKLLLSLFLILNVIISLIYLILIHNVFTHAFF